MCYSLILRNIICTCWCVLGQFQNYHTNMKRLDITLTKFIKLHDCIPVNVRFAVCTQNFPSVNGISWYKTNYYTEDSFRTHLDLLQVDLLASGASLFLAVKRPTASDESLVLILCSFSSLLVSEARYFRIMVVLSLTEHFNIILFQKT